VTPIRLARSQRATTLGFLGGYTPEWAPDSRSVVVWASDDGRDDRLGYYRVDVRTGEATAVVIRGGAEPANSALSPDGRRFFYRHPDRGIVVRDLTTSRERVVVSGPNVPFRLSPDGRRIAYARDLRRPEGWATALLVQQVDEAAPREILRVDRPDFLRLQAWSPDGTRLLYTRASGDRAHQLWAVPISAGTPISLGVSFIRSGSGEPNGLSLSPDGRQIAYPERVVQAELWIGPLAPAETTEPPQ